MLAGKIWGKTEVLLKTPMVEIHRLTINPNSRCSLHAHQFKWNAFYVSTGKLTIETHKNDYALTDNTDLHPGDLMTVKPTEYHRFVTGPEGMTGIEIYYPEPLSEDIIRKDVGGVASEPDKVAPPIKADAVYHTVQTLINGEVVESDIIEADNGSIEAPLHFNEAKMRWTVGPYGNSF